MARALFFVLLGLTALCGIHGLQEQEEDLGPCECETLRAEVKDLQRNVTDLWVYIYKLRNAMAQQLKHLREHQISAEHQIEDLSHHGGHSSDTHHSHERQDSGEHDHHAEESGHHEHHTAESSHHDEHGHHHEESSHHHEGDSTGHDDHHHEESGHHDDHDSSSHTHTHEGTDSHGGDHSHDHSHGSDHSHDHSHGSDHSHDHSHGSDHSRDHSQDHSHDGDSSKEHKEDIAEKVVVATTHRHHHHDHSHDMRSSSARSHSHGHHGHHDHGSTVNKTMVFPKVSEYDQYTFATCRVEPNRNIPEEQQQDVRGEVTLWQLKTGGPIGIHVRLQGFQMGSHHGQHVQSQDQQETADVETHSQDMSHKHGFHVHASGDTSNGCQSMGSHFNPEGVNHGGPSSVVRHVGDLGNIECDDHGFTNLAFSDSIASLIGPNSILDRGLVVHSNADDYGMKADDPESLKTGNAGTRIACCVIQGSERPSLKAFKYIKRAKPYQN